MASPTAIPHPSNSSHHAGDTAAGKDVAADASSSSSPPPRLSYSPNNTSPPRAVISPIYTQAGRSAFSMPGPNSASTSPTTTSWYSAGFASGNSQRVRSPTHGVGSMSGQGANGGSGGTHHQRGFSNAGIQRDNFPELSKSTPQHLRSCSFSSGSSSISSADLEPTTPRGNSIADGAGSASLGRTPSLNYGSPVEQIKVKPNAGRRESWGFPVSGGAASTGRGWAGLGSLRDRQFPPTTMTSDFGSGTSPEGAAPSSGGMSGLLRNFSFGGSPPSQSGFRGAAPSNTTMAAPETLDRGRSESVTVMESTAATAPTVPATVDSASAGPAAPAGNLRGRRTTVAVAGGNPNQRRKPSPMGERLLMGHFTGH